MGKTQNDGWAILDMWPPADNLPASQLFVQSEFLANINYYASFAVTIIADVLCLVCGILAIVSWRSNDVSPAY